MIEPISARLSSVAFDVPQTTTSQPETSFGSMLLEAAQGVTASLRSAETTAIDGIRGATGIRDVAESVMAAERQLGAATAIRDKIVTAYLEISRMAI